ncbi:MAG: hypothetical protein EAZ08_03250 [Cytophagales bacterium]|nr:MAG: hypothetical protein EAZ08_03250 [Cytophagales bacterium]
MNIQIILQKFEQVLASISQEQQEKLAAELAKIVPQSPDSLLDWRSSWAYNFDTNQIEVKFHIKVHSFESLSISSLAEVLPLFFVNEALLASSEDILEKLISEGISPYQLACWQVVFLENNTAFLRFSISAHLQNSQEKFYELSTIYAKK